MLTVNGFGVPLGSSTTPHTTTLDWLRDRGQTEKLTAWLWEPLALAALNQAPDEALATPFVRVLAEIRAEAWSVCPEFDAYFFPAFKAYLLADGRITPSERFEVLRVVYGGGRIDDAERRFLDELWEALPKPCPEFAAFYQQALRD